MNRTIKDATVRRFYYASHEELDRNLADFVNAYNFAERLKTLKGLTPYEFICKEWTSKPELFIANPLHHMPGLNIKKVARRRLSNPFVMNLACRASLQNLGDDEEPFRARLQCGTLMPHTPLGQSVVRRSGEACLTERDLVCSPNQRRGSE